MSPRMSLGQLNTFLTETRQKVEDVARELGEVQFQFVSAHQEFKTRHDATLNDLSLRATYSLDACPAEVRQAIDGRLTVERETLQERRRELAERSVPQAEQMADDLLARAQQATDQLRSLNPRLNEREEKLKAERVEMQSELTKLNDEIKQRSGCLGVFVNFFKIGELDRRRHKLIGRMEENARELQSVREEWSQASTSYAGEQQQLRQDWEQANVEAARTREELAQLNDDDKREGLVLQRAIFHVFDHWKTALPGQAGPLVDEINQMVQLNIQTDDYEQGLGKVAGLIALLGGISQGLQSVGQSVEALINEQKMHSSYLKTIDVDLDETVVQFHGRWDELRSKVKDEKTLGKNPAQFSALFDAEVKDWLAEATIKRMFESLGSALTAATRSWKG